MAKERLSRSDKGVTALVHSFMKDGMGLSPKTISLVMKRIRDQGELAQMKNHMRGLGGSTYKRINQAMDMAEEDVAKMSKGKKEDDQEEKAAPDKAEANDETEVKEGKFTFMHHLLNELNVRDIAADEVETVSKEERMRRARMGDTQLKRERTKELTDQQRSKDPIDKKIVQLRQQIAKLQKRKKEAGGDTEGTV